VEPDGLGRLLRPRAHTSSGNRELDSARIDRALQEQPVTISYQHGVENVVSAVTEGRADFGVLLRPATVEQIAATANASTLMPPKSTFFAPKPKTGFVLRSLSAS
jgi:uncharacterized protein (DUF1015 family)